MTRDELVQMPLADIRAADTIEVEGIIIKDREGRRHPLADWIWEGAWSARRQAVTETHP